MIPGQQGSLETTTSPGQGEGESLLTDAEIQTRLLAGGCCPRDSRSFLP